MLLFDAQTSGGLLLAIPPQHLSHFAEACAERNQDYWVIGEVLSGSGIEIVD